MPAQTIKVAPQAVTQAASQVAQTTTQAASPANGVVPMVVSTSPGDAALAAIASGVAAKSAQLSGALAAKGPQVESTTQAGVAQLQGLDETNATQLQAVGQSAAADPGIVASGAGGMGSTSGPGIVETAFKTSLGNGWDDETEEEMDAPPGWIRDHWGNWSPPVMDPGGARGGTGYGRAPI